MIGALKNIADAKDRKRVRVNLTIRRDIWDRARRKAAEEGLSASRMVELFLSGKGQAQK